MIFEYILAAVFAFFTFIFAFLWWQIRTQNQILVKENQSKISPDAADKIALEKTAEKMKEETIQIRALAQEEAKIKIVQIKAEKQEQLEDYKREIRSRFAEKESNLREEIESKNQITLSKQKLELEKTLQNEEKIMRQRILELQENVDKKETILTNKLEELTSTKLKLEEFKQELSNQRIELDSKEKEFEVKNNGLENEIIEKLAKIANLSLTDAKKMVIDKAKKEMGEELLSWQQKYLSNFQSEANEKAREIVSLAIQRCSSEVANEITITTVALQNEEDKGRLIGKQGRNIIWLEKTLGVELIIDDTPGVVTLSGFSSLRRNIAKRTLEKLLVDGRVHPASIEEMYEKARGEIAQDIAEAGQWAMNELGIYDFPPKLIRLIGRLKFRTSYGQNQLKHSVEMGRLAGLMADNMNAYFPSKTPIDRMVCVKGAMLHDIGKAIDEEQNPKGNHIEIGEKICDMFDLGWQIRKCISSHHTTGGDVQSYFDPEHGFCLEAAIVDACDNLSGSRPGARKETMEAYFQRMEALEKVVNSYPGVTKSWVMRGAKEIWIFFDAKAMQPSELHTASREIANEINASVRTPQEIKVICFREDRIETYTR